MTEIFLTMGSFIDQFVDDELQTLFIIEMNGKGFTNLETKLGYVFMNSVLETVKQKSHS